MAVNYVDTMADDMNVVYLMASEQHMRLLGRSGLTTPTDGILGARLVFCMSVTDSESGEIILSLTIKIPLSLRPPVVFATKR